MKKLNHGLLQLCRRNRDGAFSTQKDRERALLLMADQLRELGFQTGSMAPGA